MSGIFILIGILLVAAVLVSPHLTVYDLVILAPAFLLLVDWTLDHSAENQSSRFQLLIYSCFILFLLGPIVRVIHVQFSVLAMSAIVVIAYRLCVHSFHSARDQILPA